MNDNIPLGCTTETTAIGYILFALCASDAYDYVEVSGLPSAVFVPECNVMIAVTTAPAPSYRRAIGKAAAAWGADVILIRTRPIDDMLMIATVDVVAAALPCDPWTESDMSIWTDGLGAVWLVSDGTGPCVSITNHGFNIEMVPPHHSQANRQAGIYRAANDLARFANPIGAR